jgi:hypothetical protein
MTTKEKEILFKVDAEILSFEGVEDKILSGATQKAHDAGYSVVNIDKRQSSESLSYLFLLSLKKNK